MVFLKIQLKTLEFPYGSSSEVDVSWDPFPEKVTSAPHETNLTLTVLAGLRTCLFPSIPG